MNTKCNVVTMLAATLLVASTTAGAQVLGGGLGGAVNGAMGGSFGGHGINGGGSLVGSGNGSFGAGDTLGATRDRLQQAGGRTRNAAASATSTAGSRVESTRGAGTATANAAQSAGIAASHEAASRAADARAPEAGSAPAATSPANGVLLGGSGSASAQKHAMGRTVAADGASESALGVDRSGVQHGHAGNAGVSVQKDEPAPSPAQ